MHLDQPEVALQRWCRHHHLLTDGREAVAADHGRDPRARRRDAGRVDGGRGGAPAGRGVAVRARHLRRPRGRDPPRPMRSGDTMVLVTASLKRARTSATTSFTDTTGIVGQAYYYRITAFDNGAIEEASAAVT